MKEAVIERVETSKMVIPYNFLKRVQDFSTWVEISQIVLWELLLLIKLN
jgi:hypothetical protein